MGGPPPPPGSVGGVYVECYPTLLLGDASLFVVGNALMLLVATPNHHPRPPPFQFTMSVVGGTRHEYRCIWIDNPW